MCGIVGYIGHRRALPILIKGLERLEYRGYDSSGVACLVKGRPFGPPPARGMKPRAGTAPASPGKPGEASAVNGPETVKLGLVKEKGKLIRLKEKLNGRSLDGCVGIGHTRWATHGAPSVHNAHPHTDCTKKFALVHNGIIENFSELRHELEKKGHRFKSQTDTEVAVHLIEAYFQGNVREAFQQAIARMKGDFAFGLVSTYEPSSLFVFKRSNPLVIGVGRNEHFIASDAPAIMPYTNRVVYLDDDEMAEVGAKSIRVFRLGRRAPVRKRAVRLHWDVRQAEKGGFPHFMLKEIHEQPRVMETILKSRLRGGKIHFEGLHGGIEKRLKKIEKIHLVSCGTAYHAGLVGNYMLGECVRLPVRASVSSEFRYEDPVVGGKDLVIVITQSGETADTLAALREAKAKKAFTLAIVNVVGSTIAREADAVIYTHAGPEIGVASTKAYLSQLMILALFSLYLGKLRGCLSPSDLRESAKWLWRLPKQVQQTLEEDHAIQRCARGLYGKRHFLYLGRGYNFPNALEGALKLKEITYAHAHGYPAGEMKHGPIALVDSDQPIICLAPQSKTYDKMVSNIEEIRARKGIVISIITRGDEKVQALSKYYFSVPETKEIFSPLLTVVPLQLFAYHVAVLNRRDVDQPRNLAKSVTVE